MVHRSSHSQWVLYPFCATGICNTHYRWFNCSRRRSLWMNTYFRALIYNWTHFGHRMLSLSQSQTLSGRSHGVTATATAMRDKNGLHRMSIGHTTRCNCNCKLRLQNILVAGCHRYDHNQWVLYPFCATGICDTLHTPYDTHCRWFNRSRSRTVWTGIKCEQAVTHLSSSSTYRMALLSNGSNRIRRLRPCQSSSLPDRDRSYRTNIRQGSGHSVPHMSYHRSYPCYHFLLI